MTTATANKSSNTTKAPVKTDPVLLAIHSLEMMVANPPKASQGVGARDSWREECLDAMTTILTQTSRSTIAVDLGDGIKGNVSPRRLLAIIALGDTYGGKVTRANRIKAAKS